MTLLTVDVLGARAAEQTASPAVVFRLRIESLSGPVHAVAFRCQTRIEPRGRRYSRDEQGRLYELFGDVSQWDRTLRGVSWAQTSLVVPSFAKRIEVDLPVACTYDLEVASAKYLHAVRDGAVPLVFLFNGTVFTVNDGGIQIEPVSWDLEASYRMPAPIWQSTMDQFFPGGGWLRVSRETLDRLQAFRGRNAMVNWDDAIERLLRYAAEGEMA